MKLRILLISIAISAVMASASVAQTFQFQSGPIKFRSACFSTADRGDICWIVADGEITADTPKQFRQFLLANKVQHGSGLEVYLNSPGGNIIGGIELGKVIREFGLGTRVAQSVPDNGPISPSGERPETDATGGCYSACAFAFLGGKWRKATDRSIGVHQSYFKEALAQPNVPKFTAQDFSQQQVIEGLVLEYVVSMGVDPKFLTYAAATEPTNLYFFSSKEMDQFGITWDDLQYTDWSLEARGNGLVVASKTRNGERSATLFCRQDQALRLSIDMPNPFKADATVDWIVSLWSGASMFSADIPLKDISTRKVRDRLSLEVLVPPALKDSKNNWLPDGKTAAWYVRELQYIGNSLSYDPTGAEWPTLTSERKQLRRQIFELAYKGTFGSSPTYAADGSPMVPSNLEIPRNFGGLSISGLPGLGDAFSQNLPGKNFLSYSKLVRRNCI